MSRRLLADRQNPDKKRGTSASRQVAARSASASENANANASRGDRAWQSQPCHPDKPQPLYLQGLSATTAAWPNTCEVSPPDFKPSPGYPTLADKRRRACAISGATFLLPLLPPALLALADGSVFHGIAVGAAGHTVGEVVFNTALTGYQEILTDPSYCRQLVTLTYPPVGS